MAKGINTTLDEGQTPIVVGGSFDEAVCATGKKTHALTRSSGVTEDGTGRGTTGVPLPVPMINMQGSKGNAVAQEDGPSYTLNAMHGHDVHAVAVRNTARVSNARSIGNGSVVPTLRAKETLNDYTPIVTTGTLSSRTTAGGGLGTDFELAGGLLPQPLPFDTTQVTSPLNRSSPREGDPCHPLAAGAHAPAIAFHPTQDPISSEESCHALSGGNRNGCARAAVLTPLAVRRLTPRECERLMGVPDDYTRIPWRGKAADACPDGPRYKALGNSMAVPVVRWIGERLAKVDAG